MTMAHRTAERAVEDGQETVAGGFHETPIMLLQGGLDDLAAISFHAREGALLVRSISRL